MWNQLKKLEYIFEKYSLLNFAIVLEYTSLLEPSPNIAILFGSDLGLLIDNVASSIVTCLTSLSVGKQNGR